MSPSDVTNGMVRECRKQLPMNWSNRGILLRALAAALTAMPDDLLRKLVAERGWVVVPREREGRLRAMLQDATEALSNLDTGDMWELIADCNAALADSDPRQQAQDATWKPASANEGMRFPEQSDLTGGATDCEGQQAQKPD